MLPTRYGCMIRGATRFTVTVVDVLRYLDELKSVWAMRLMAKVTKDFPSFYASARKG